MADTGNVVIDGLQNLLGQVPEFIQPLVVALAGAVPFIEGAGATSLGILGGINPIVAAVAAAAGNFLCVALLVLLGAGVRNAVTSRRTQKVPVGAGAAAGAAGTSGGASGGGELSPRRAKFQKAFDRYGVPGVSLLGPLLLPTQFTAVMLAGVGITKGRILIWQAAAILVWTTGFTLVVTGILGVVAG